MIEPIMYVGIGFLVAGLLVIGVIPLVHGRAVRLTQRRLEAMTPLSMAEIQADKDQLRAEFAMSTRRLEMSVEQMKAKTSNQLAEIGKLKLELGDKTAALFAAEAREKQLTDELEAIRTESGSRSASLDEIRRALSATQSQLAQSKASYGQASTTTDSQRVELMALRAQTEVLQGQIESYDKETKDQHNRLARRAAEIEALSHQLTEERAKSETLGNRVTELDRLLISQTTEAEILGRRVTELVARLDEQGRFLADRESVSDRLRTEAAAAQKIETAVRSELAEAEKRHRAATEAIRTEKALLEDQLKQSQEERGKLQREIAGMKREAESTWATERMENAVLRERINDVAAEVARLTATLEGSGSPIDTILAADAGRPAAAPNGTKGSGAPPIAPNGGEQKGTLADRIRALQSRASRVPQPSGA